MIQWANLSIVCQEITIARILGQLPPAIGMVHSYITWLQETADSESNTVTHFILRLPGRTELYSYVWCFKMCCPHLHFRKILCWQIFAPPETNFKQRIIYKGKTPFSKWVFCTLIGSSKPLFFCPDSFFQQFHITCLTICLPSMNQLNQRAQKSRHGRNWFAPETSEGQFDFALSSVQ